MKELDVLNREEFVHQVISVIKNISDKQTSTCFAINGQWGCGKSFVLDMIQQQLENIYKEQTNENKFFVIRYNSWKFDYYAEPLVAIVASIMDIINKETALFPDSPETRELLGILKATGISLLSIGADAIKAKTGLDFQKAYEIIKKGQAESYAKYQSEHEYDVYFSFNTVLNELSEVLHDLSNYYTVVFLVDELDRCIPEYSIKVLERLHHLLEGQSNIITVLAIDKTQLLSSVKQIFGFKEPEKYLAKFINFEVKLDCGQVSDKICEKYADYIALFDKELFVFAEPIEEFIQAIFADIDIRTQKQLVKKAILIHKLLYTDKKDYSFMCMELLLAVMICVYKDTSCFTKASIDITSFDKIFMPYSNSEKPVFAKFFQDKFETISFVYSTSYFPDGNKNYNYVLPNKANLYGAILFTWFWMHDTRNVSLIQHKKDGVYEPISKNYQELKKFAEMIKTIS